MYGTENLERLKEIRDADYLDMMFDKVDERGRDGCFRLRRSCDENGGRC